MSALWKIRPPERSKILRGRAQRAGATERAENVVLSRVTYTRNYVNFTLESIVAPDVYPRVERSRARLKVPGCRRRGGEGEGEGMASPPPTMMFRKGEEVGEVVENALPRSRHMARCTHDSSTGQDDNYASHAIRNGMALTGASRN